MTNFLHHYEYQNSGLNINDIKKLIEEKSLMYDHNMIKEKINGKTINL